MSKGIDEPMSHDSNAPPVPSPEVLCHWSESELLEAKDFLGDDGATGVAGPIQEHTGNINDVLQGTTDLIHETDSPTRSRNFHSHPRPMETNSLFFGYGESIVPACTMEEEPSEPARMNDDYYEEDDDDDGDDDDEDTKDDDPDYMDSEYREDGFQYRNLHTSRVAVARGAFTHNDVLMGRGGRSNHHPGNQLYLRDKDALRGRYLNTQNKAEKTRISEELVGRVHERGGRFVQLNDQNGEWEEVEFLVARRKASQSLREESTPESRRAKRKKYGTQTKRKK